MKLFIQDNVAEEKLQCKNFKAKVNQRYLHLTPLI